MFANVPMVEIFCHALPFVDINELTRGRSGEEQHECLSKYGSECHRWQRSYGARLFMNFYIFILLNAFFLCFIFIFILFLCLFFIFIYFIFYLYLYLYILFIFIFIISLLIFIILLFLYFHLFFFYFSFHFILLLLFALLSEERLKFV